MAPRAARIGRVSEAHEGAHAQVRVRTAWGSTRVLDMLVGEQLPASAKTNPAPAGEGTLDPRLRARRPHIPVCGDATFNPSPDRGKWHLRTREQTGPAKGRAMHPRRRPATDCNQRIAMLYTTVISISDGTLLDTLDDLAAAGNHVCAAHGWPTFTRDPVPLQGGQRAAQAHRAPHPAEFAGNGRVFEETIRAFRAYYDAHKEDARRPTPACPELLDTLRDAGVRLAVLTNKDHPAAAPLVARYFGERFDLVQGRIDAFRPNRRHPSRGTCSNSSTPDPSRTLYVGDSNVDVATGHNAGLAVAGVAWGFRGRAELEQAGAEYVVDTPAEARRAYLVARGYALRRQLAKAQIRPMAKHREGTRYVHEHAADAAALAPLGELAVRLAPHAPQDEGKARKTHHVLQEGLGAEKADEVAHGITAVAVSVMAGMRSAKSTPPAAAHGSDEAHHKPGVGAHGLLETVPENEGVPQEGETGR